MLSGPKSHSVFVGDTVAILPLDACSADFTVTDPPYGLGSATRRGTALQGSAVPSFPPDPPHQPDQRVGRCPVWSPSTRDTGSVITDSFNPDSPEVTSPTAIAVPIPECPATAVVTFQRHTWDVLLDNWQSNSVRQVNAGGACDVDVRLVENGHHKVGVCLSPIGAPTAAALLEELAVCGFRRFVVFGTCGVLVPQITNGHLVVPTSAVRDEGTSYHYAPPSDTIDIATAPRLVDILAELEIPHIEGAVWTTDAFYRETRALVERRVAQGCIAVDMEVSALAAMSQFRGIEIFHYLCAADSLADDWNPELLWNLGDKPRAVLWEVAFAVARRLDDEVATSR